MKTIPNLIKKYLLNPLQKNSHKKITDQMINCSAGNTYNRIQVSEIITKLTDALKQINEIFHQSVPTSMSLLRELIENVRKIIISIQQFSIPTAR